MMYKVYKDDKFIREFKDEKEAHKFKEDCMDRDIKNKNTGHRYRVEEQKE